MHTALTLICNPARPVITAPLTEAVSNTLEGFANSPVITKILGQGIAVDFLFEFDGKRAPLRESVLIACQDTPIDVVVQPARSRTKKLLIADMDSTIIQQECIDELAEFAGKRDEISDITERAMRGELDFDNALKERVAMLKGLPESVIEQTFQKCITLTPGARGLVQTMKARGAHTALVSGGFTAFTEQVARATGFHETRANTLLIENGELTGNVGEPILGKQAKLDALNELIKTHNLASNDALAVGDGANDLAMIGAAGSGVAFHAKPAVAAAADIQINYGDLTALLYLQGIAKDSFVN